MSRGRLAWLVAAFLIGILLPTGTIWWGFYHTQTDASGELWIYRGQPASAALQQLPDSWRNPVQKLVTRLMARRFHFQAGYYKYTTSDTLAPFLGRLNRGESDLVAVTIAEGTNMYEIAGLLQKAHITMAKPFLTACTDKVALRDRLKMDLDRCEGYLFPDTYEFRPFQPPTVVRDTMLKLFQQKTKRLFKHYSLSEPASMHRVLTLASIVEKETGLATERPLIASVFLNRLFRNMRLQSDPTTIYGIWERFDGNLRKKDLQEKTAYNTYRINGLPPGPIANPGLASIEAVLRPAASNYLYFVADGSGGHTFSQTHRQHINAVNRYQKKRRHPTY